MQINRRHIIALLFGLIILFRFITSVSATNTRCDDICTIGNTCCCIAPVYPTNEPILSNMQDTCTCHVEAAHETSSAQWLIPHLATDSRQLPVVLTLLRQFVCSFESVSDADAELFLCFSKPVYPSRHILALQSVLLI